MAVMGAAGAVGAAGVKCSIWFCTAMVSVHTMKMIQAMRAAVRLPGSGVLCGGVLD